MQSCSYCNRNFLENILDHLSSEQHKKIVLKSKTIKSTFQEYRNYIEKRSMPTEEYKIILKLGKLELSNPDFKELEEYLSTMRNRLGGENNEKFRRIKIKAVS